MDKKVAPRRGFKIDEAEKIVEVSVYDREKARSERVTEYLNKYKPSLDEVEILTIAPRWWYDEDLTFIVQEYDETHYKVLEKTETHLTHLIKKCDCKIITNDKV